MSSTDVVLSPKKKKMDQIVSSSESNGHDLTDKTESVNDNEDESVNTETLITNQSETNKDCHDACMEPLLIQNCADDFATNDNNEPECVSPSELIDAADAQDESQTDEGGGGFMKSNLSLNLNTMLGDGKSMPKNKKFLESSDDQIINQIFFSTITVTPTADEDVLASKFLSSDNTPLTPNEDDIDPDLHVGSVDFFNQKIDEDEAFDTTFTDTAENYQENDGNLCSLNDNLTENYCSFSSIDYNTNVQQQQQPEVESPENQNDLLQPDFLGDYAEIMRQQRPSIVIDCYDSDSNSDKNSQTDEDVVVGEAKVNDYCFYFDQTIEEDDDDACFPNGVGDDSENTPLKENGSLEGETKVSAKLENGKTLEEVDECFETEDEIFNDEGEEDEGSQNELDEDKSLASDEDDEGVINESCISVNVSSCRLTRLLFKFIEAGEG